MDDNNETKNSLTISAVMPAYNAEKYIARAIDSVLGQTRTPDEFIVIDDGSTDDTAGIVKSYGDKIRYVYQENGGESAARNTGIKEATCDWIAFLDSDDEWLEGNLEMLEGVIVRNSDLVWAFGNFYNCDCQDESRSIAHSTDKACKIPLNGECFDNYLKCFNGGFHAWTGTNIIKKSIFDKIGLYVLGQHRGADTDMWLRIAYDYPKVGYVAEPLAIYHRGIATSMSSLHRNLSIISAQLEKHLKLSTEKGAYDDFVPCASSMLGNRIRENFSAGQADGILEIIERYDELLSFRFKMEMRLRIKHPKVAPAALAITSTIKKCKRFTMNLFGGGK